jgi:hypothetical protein
VPVRHLVFEPGSGAREPDKAAEARYRREFDEAVATRKRKVVLQPLAGLGILAALLMSTVALVRSGERREASATPQLVVKQAATTAPVARRAAAKMVDLKIIPSYKLAPDGKKHDAFTKTDFAVSVSQPLKLRIDNTDNQPHSITSPGAGVNITIRPGTHTYTLIVAKPGRVLWFCVFPCDSDANGWAMRHPDYMSGYITAS